MQAELEPRELTRFIGAFERTRSFRNLLCGLLFGACVPHERPESNEQDAGREPDRTSSQPNPKDPPGPLKRQAMSDSAPAPRGATAKIAQFTDDFERTSLGPDWLTTSKAWTLESGRLCAEHARNRGIWLNRPIGDNARIEFEASSASADGDLKVEVWGDGKSYAASTSYDDATSYILIFGGWKNSLHVLARLNEHGQDRLALTIDPTSTSPRARPVEPNRTYRFRIERRDGKTLRWFVDDALLHKLVDSEPLRGVGHDHFGFNDWDAKVCFDKLRVTNLED